MPKPHPRRTPAPTASPTPAPTASPTPAPTASPTPAPTASPTPAPTASPTPAPTTASVPVTGWEDWGGYSATDVLKIGPSQGGAGRVIDLPAGSYVLSMKAYATSANEQFSVGIKSMDSAGNELANDSRPVIAVTPASLNIGFTRPSNAARTQLYVWKNSTTGYGYVSDITVAVATPAPTFAPTPAPAPAPAPVGGTGYPFGSRKEPYLPGTILPMVAPGAMDAVLYDHYLAWRAHAVKPVKGALAVAFSNQTFATVSEGMGYGMLLAVVFDDKATFDGLLATVINSPAYAITPFDPNGRYLMDWRLYADGSSAGEGWNAMDGDEDIALALLMAHRQWGSPGYLQRAHNTIAALKSWNMRPDGTTKGLSKPDVSRTSDYMLGHFRAYRYATADSFWNTAVERSQLLLEHMQKNYSSVGLVPDFIVNTDTNPIPSPGMRGDGNMNEHHYWWNACRVPWRLATDYLLYGDVRTKNILMPMMAFFEREGTPDVTNIGTGYAIADGQKITGGNSPAYHGPILAGACVDSAMQNFCDRMWAWNASRLTVGYYDSEIQLLSMVVASGNWWKP